MKTSNEQKEISSATNKIDAQPIEFQGKLSFILHTLKIIVIISLTESPYIRNAEDKIEKIKALFSNYEKQDINQSLLQFILVQVGGLLTQQLPTNSYGLKAITEFSKYLKNQIEFQQFFESLIKLLKEVISFVKIRGSRANSIQIINDFSNYLTNYSNKLEKVKNASSLENVEEGEKIQSTKKENKKKEISEKSYYEDTIKNLNNEIMSLKDEIRKKEKDLEISNSKIIQANLDTGTYKDINIFLENKLKEMERKFDSKFKNNGNEITSLKKVVIEQNNEIANLKNENSDLKKVVNVQNNEITNFKKIVTSQNNEIANLKKDVTTQNNEITNLKKAIIAQNGTIALQENTIQLLKEQNNALFEMENQDREQIRTIRDSFYQLDADYNDAIDTVDWLNISLQQIINNLEYDNPFNINFFE